MSSSSAWSPKWVRYASESSLISLVRNRFAARVIDCIVSSSSSLRFVQSARRPAYRG